MHSYDIDPRVPPSGPGCLECSASVGWWFQTSSVDRLLEPFTSMAEGVSKSGHVRYTRQTRTDRVVMVMR